MFCVGCLVLLVAMVVMVIDRLNMQMVLFDRCMYVVVRNGMGV